MAWQSVVIANPAKLRCELKQLVIEQATALATVPLEDLDAVVLDDSQISLTVPLLREFARHGIAVIICDEKHLPCGTLLSHSQHFRAAGVLRAQLAVSKPLAKRLWQRLVSAKVQNQSTVLAKCAGQADNPLLRLIPRINSGDSANIEAQAAKIYWPKLLGATFRRGAPHYFNSLLDFGYSIIRSCLARAVVDRGLLPALGLFHKNLNNPFCLVDDLIEPFRPFVDRVVVQLTAGQAGEEDLTRENRQRLIAIMYDSCFMNKQEISLQSGCLKCVDSLLSAFQDNNYLLLETPTMGD